MKIKVKKMHENATLPKFGMPGDAGADLTASSIDVTNNYIEYDTGIAVEIPDGYVGMVFPRSSVTNKSLMLKNSVGIIDSQYRGTIKCRFQNFSDFDTKRTEQQAMGIYKVGERVAQMIIMEVPKVEYEFSDELSGTERGTGGFGHTGNK